ncbi:hypothetical protein ACWDTP_07735 [Mycobacterium sp. NPDC003449]
MSEEATDDGTDPRRWAMPARKGLAVLLAVVILAGTAVLTWLWIGQRDRENAAREGLAAAQQFVGALTNIDAAHLDENFRLVIDGSTGEFRDMYGQSSAQLRQLLVENKATAHGMVVESAVKSASPDRVEVLLFVDQSVTNAAAPEPRLDRSRIRITMQKVDGRWLAGKVELP